MLISSSSAFRKSFLCTTSAILACGAIAVDKASAASLTPVDVELSLLIDGSGSISFSDFNLQQQAYVNVFNDPDLYNQAISKGANGRIAVNAIQFGSAVREEVGWTLIDSVSASQEFASKLAGFVRRGGATNMGGAIQLATKGILNNNFQGESTLAIDISTDGRPTTGPNATLAAKDALDKGVDVINAIAVGFANVEFLEENIIGGENLDGSSAFVEAVDSFDEFETILADKIFKEVGGVDPQEVPEPVSVIAIGAFSLFGLGVLANQKRSAA